MGLSDRERAKKLIYATEYMVEAGEDLSTEYSKLRGMVDQLWPALLRKQTNGLYWFCGGSTDTNHIDGGSLFDTILLHHKPRQKDEIEELEDRNEEVRFTNTIHDMTDFGYILRGRNPSAEVVLKIFQGTKAAAYALRRYSDEFSEGLKEYDDLLCRIQGECFKLFKNCPDILEAWLQNRIIRQLFTWANDDIVNQWWMKQHIYHNMLLISPPDNIPVERLLEIFKKIQFNAPTVNQRVLLTIELAKHRWQYTHQHNEAIKMFEEYNSTNPKEKIDIEAVKKAAKKCVSLKEQNEKITRERYASNVYCELTDNHKLPFKPHKKRKAVKAKENKAKKTTAPSPKAKTKTKTTKNKTR